MILKETIGAEDDPADSLGQHQTADLEEAAPQEEDQEAAGPSSKRPRRETRTPPALEDWVLPTVGIPAQLVGFMRVPSVDQLQGGEDPSTSTGPALGTTDKVLKEFHTKGQISEAHKADIINRLSRSNDG